MSDWRLLRSALKSILPNWLADRPGLNVGFSFLYSIALVGDALIETSWEGLQAAFPGVGTDTALPYLGQSRGLIQGPTETNANYYKRLIAWLTTWQNAGQGLTMAQQLQGYLMGQGILGAGVVPTIRVVDRSGQWAIANSNGTTSHILGSPFNWDGVNGYDDGFSHISPATVAGYWSDIWIIVAPATGSSPIFPYYTGTSDPAWIGNFGPSATFGGGMQIPLVTSNGMLQTISALKGSHTWVRGIIFAPDTTSFSPGTPTVDGTWGDWGKLVAATGVEVSARTIGRFIIPPQG